MANENGINRRDILRTSLASAAGFTLASPNVVKGEPTGHQILYSEIGLEYEITTQVTLTPQYVTSDPLKFLKFHPKERRIELTPAAQTEFVKRLSRNEGVSFVQGRPIFEEGKVMTQTMEMLPVKLGYLNSPYMAVRLNDPHVSPQISVEEFGPSLAINLQGTTHYIEAGEEAKVPLPETKVSIKTFTTRGDQLIAGTAPEEAKTTSSSETVTVKPAAVFRNYGTMKVNTR